MITTTTKAKLVAASLLIALALALALPRDALAAPANDNFAEAQELSSYIGAGGSLGSGTTAGATREQGEPYHCDTDRADCASTNGNPWPGDHTVWHRWTPANSGAATIDVCTANIDSILAVYTGDRLDGLTRVVDDNNGCASGYGSKVSFDATAGTTYRIAVGDAGGARENTFTLKVSFSSYTVTNTNDSGEGSLRQALLNANANVGTANIGFNLPGGDGVKTIAPASPLPAITDKVNIDGYTQPGASPATADASANLLVELKGNGGIGLNLQTDNSTVRGLAINRFAYQVYIEGAGSTGNTVEGNHLGTDAAGTQPLGNGTGVEISDAKDNTIGGTTPAARNVISGNGIGVEIYDGNNPGDATGNLVQGNYIGIKANGTEALGNTFGLYIEADDNVVGGATRGARNVISGNTYAAVYITRSYAALGGTGNRVQGNYVGTGKDGASDLGNASYGVIVVGSYNSIGGNEARSNVIAHSDRDGVVVFGGIGNAILANSIYANTEQGIDLNHDGVTANDPGDADTGTNNLQNYPVLSSVAVSGGTATVKGTLDSTPDTYFTVQFFSDPSAGDEGKTLLGQQTVKTGTDGKASFTFTASGVSEGDSVTATATDQYTDDTSEFSSPVVVDTTGPMVASYSTSGARSAPITASFSERVDPETLTTSTVKLEQYNARRKRWQPVPIGVSYDDAARMVILDPYPTDPSRLLAANAKYRVTITTGVKDTAGNPLDQNPSTTGNQGHSWIYTTGSS